MRDFTEDDALMKDARDFVNSDIRLDNEFTAEHLLGLLDKPSEVTP